MYILNIYKHQKYYKRIKLICNKKKPKGGAIATSPPSHKFVPDVCAFDALYCTR